jgi:endoglucanase
MIQLIREGVDYDRYFVFNVQEEVGLRGSTVSSFAVAPDFAIVLEATTASDIDGVGGAKKVCSLGNGPVVSFMDRSTIYDKELYSMAFDITAEFGIPCQTKTMIAGGNDSGAIHKSRGGVRTIAVSAPCRYIHSPSCVINMEDFENMLILTRELAKRIHEL